MNVLSFLPLKDLLAWRAVSQAFYAIATRAANATNHRITEYDFNPKPFGLAGAVPLKILRRSTTDRTRTSNPQFWDEAIELFVDMERIPDDFTVPPTWHGTITLSDNTEKLKLQQLRAPLERVSKLCVHYQTTYPFELFQNVTEFRLGRCSPRLVQIAICQTNALIVDTLNSYLQLLDFDPTIERTRTVKLEDLRVDDLNKWLVNCVAHPLCAPRKLLVRNILRLEDGALSDCPIDGVHELQVVVFDDEVEEICKATICLFEDVKRVTLHGRVRFPRLGDAILPVKLEFPNVLEKLVLVGFAKPEGYTGFSWNDETWVQSC